LATTLAAGGLVVGAASSAEAATVTVHQGQNLTQIAAELHTSVAALVAANHLSDPNRVLAGQVLQVPSGTSAGPGSVVVVVGRGDTLSSIAARYRSSVSAIAAANGIADVNHVLAGSRLRVPLAAASDMALASYSLPAGSSHYPAQLLAHPSRLTLLPYFEQAAATYGVPLSLLEALCWWESGWQTTVLSSTGAIGVCQIEPSTATFVNRYLVRVPLDAHVAAQNIALGAAYLASLLRATGGDVGLAVAGYYQGLASVRHKGMLPSTALYVHGIEAYAAIFAS
jgi:soluble lytic murein transglycosylase-like protein